LKISTSTAKTDPNVVAATIIDGDRNGSVVTIENGEDDNCVLSGFTITNGYAGIGGGIYCSLTPGGPPHNLPPEPDRISPGPTITNCVISDNSANNYGGGGMFNNYGISPTLTNCTFNKNSVNWGSGGGMYEGPYCNSTLNNCTFNENSARGGDGGGMYNPYSSPTLTNCTFNENTADIGGGMYNTSSSPTLTNCTFTQNSARGNGWEMAYGGGMYIKNSSSKMTNCIFIVNLAMWGGGIYNRDSYYTLLNCTFSDNIAFFGGGGIGGGIGDGGNYSYPDSGTINNCIFWENEAPNGPQIYLSDKSIASVQYTNLQGGRNNVHIEPDCELIWGQGNIDDDPCFVQPLYLPPPQPPNEPPPLLTSYVSDTGQYILTELDYHLLPSSPCINAGAPNYPILPNETDLDGNPRVIGCRIDMGAYEYSNFVPVELRILPRNINLANKGKSITAYLRLPENYNVADIDFCFLFLEDEIQAESVQVNEEKRVVVASFRYEQLHGILEIGDNELTICAQLTDTTVFVGTDVIKVIYEGGGKLAKIGEAGNPNPPDGATNIGIDADLSWTPGYNAASHDVYFGTANPPPFIGNQTVTTFDPGTMDYKTTYYWRIDEVNKWDIATGNLWSFTTPPFSPPPPLPLPPPP
jgi:hypothetical protein